MRYDVIVVGAGSAGCVLAARLSENPTRAVLLLEAGPDYPEFERLPDELKNGYNQAASAADSPFNWAYVGTGTRRQAAPMQVARGKVVGGSSSVNGQVFLRGLPEDYDSWAALGNDEWAYLKVLPYFRKLETDADIRDDFHGSSGPIPVRRHKREAWHPFQEAFYLACRDAGFPEDPDMNYPDSTGVGPIPVNNAGGIRMSTALTYLNPVRHRLNLTVKPNALVRRVLFDGKQAYGVEVESGGERFTVEGAEILLSAGGIASPQLLMLSGVGPASHLRSLGIPVVQDLPGVGQNLRDHPLVTIELRVKAGVHLDLDGPRLQAGLRYTAEGSGARNDVQIFPSSYSGPALGDPLGGARSDKSPDASGSRQSRERAFGATQKLGVRLTCILELAASAGELRLASADPRDQPHLDYRYLEDPWDRQRMAESVRLCQRLLDHPASQSIVDGWIAPSSRDLASDEALEAWLLENVSTAQHTSGTCKMGPESDPMAVVDQYCRVRGLGSLRVVDLSVAPDVVRANTNATAIMIGERVAAWYP